MEKGRWAVWVGGETKRKQRRKWRAAWWGRGGGVLGAQSLCVYVPERSHKTNQCAGNVTGSASLKKLVLGTGTFDTDFSLMTVFVDIFLERQKQLCESTSTSPQFP